MKELRKMTQADMAMLVAKLHQTAIEWAKEHGVSGLSSAGSHNVYNAIEDAVFREWRMARMRHE